MQHKKKQGHIGQQKPSVQQLDGELLKLMQPIITAVAEWNTKPFRTEVSEREAERLLAWGVQSGYFLWVRQHPGQIPTMEQVTDWMQKGGLMS